MIRKIKKLFKRKVNLHEVILEGNATLNEALLDENVTEIVIKGFNEIEVKKSKEKYKKKSKFMIWLSNIFK